MNSYWKYFNKTLGALHQTFTGYYKIKVDQETNEVIGKPISISYGEYING